ncbi:MAG: hypothetical protein WBW33_15185, partial [Bryobacteraceae bacterium]
MALWRRSISAEQFPVHGGALTPRRPACGDDESPHCIAGYCPSPETGPQLQKNGYARPMRFWRITFLCSVIVLLIPAQEARRPRSYATLEIAFPGHEPGFWGRFRVTGDSPGFSGWVMPEPQMSYYRVNHLPVGPATRFKAILYSPGCALRVSDLSIDAPKEFKYMFDCDTVSSMNIRGRVTRFDRLYGHKVRIEAKYVALWAPAFYGAGDGSATAIPLGSTAALSDDGYFWLSIPDFSSDKLAAAEDHPGEIQFWARDKVSGRIVAQLRLSPENGLSQPTRFGGIPPQEINSAQLVFVPCAANPVPLHDYFGFAIRPNPDVYDACDSYRRLAP